MVKVLYILHRRPDMETAAFQAYLKDMHGPIAARVPGLARCVQSYPYPDPYGDPLPADGVVELHFDSFATMQDALASPEGQAMRADFANFLDQQRSGPIVIEEDHVVVD